MISFVKVLAAFACTASMIAVPAGAADYPSAPVRLVVPLPAGGAIDSAARIMAASLSEALKQPVVVENKPGADGAIAAMSVIGAKPDGYTLFFSSNTAICAVPTLRKNPPYDPRTALTPISSVGTLDLVLFAHPSVSGQTLTEVIEYLRSRPGQINFATPNSSSLLASVQMQRLAKLQAVNVPYKGDAPAMADLLGGQVQLMFGSPGAPLQYVEQGRLRALAALAPARIGSLPNLPTMNEAGMGGIGIVPWAGIFGPAGMPAEVVQRLSGEIAKILARPATREQLAKYGVNPRASEPAAFKRFVEEQIVMWRDTIREAGIEQN